MNVLTINCGSSSLKFDVFDVDVRTARAVPVARGAVERIGQDAAVQLKAGEHAFQQSKPLADHAEAFDCAVDLLQDAGLLADIEAVGHRVVHGGPDFTSPTLIDDSVIAGIESVSKLAPLHNLPALSAIHAARARYQGRIPMAAIFDTAFFANLPPVAAVYALPQALSTTLRIRRFGFHGLAHQYMVERYRALRPDVATPRLITLQLGNGCSATASLDGRPLDTSMGFTPLEGLIMGTRSGDLDPSLPFFLARETGLSFDEVEAILNNESGLRGLSGISNDMRDLLREEAAGNQQASLAIEAFCYRVRKYVGAYLSVLGGADALVFGGGIGEHSADIRQRIASGLKWAGLTLDDQANQAATQEDRRISSADSQIEAWVIPVDESSVIAKAAVACFPRRSSQ